MPKGRKRRASQEYAQLQQLVSNKAEACFCLLNGLCFCYKRTDSPLTVAMTSGDESAPSLAANPTEPDTVSSPTL